MGTFHRDASPLHGITLVVQTAMDETFVGRCEDEDGSRVILLDADVHRPTDEISQKEYLQRADRFGVWPRHARVEIDRADVVRLFPLGEFDRAKGTG